MTEPKKNVTPVYKKDAKIESSAWGILQSKNGFPAKEQFDWSDLLWHSALQIFDLTGKVALITISYGIGMAIAKAMAANGATIVFNDIKRELVDTSLLTQKQASRLTATSAT